MRPMSTLVESASAWCIIDRSHPARLPEKRKTGVPRCPHRRSYPRPCQGAGPRRSRRIIVGAGCAVLLVAAAACSSDGDEDTAVTIIDRSCLPRRLLPSQRPATRWPPMLRSPPLRRRRREPQSTPASGDVELPLDASGAADTALGVTPGAVIDIGSDTEGGQAVLGSRRGRRRRRNRRRTLRRSR